MPISLRNRTLFIVTLTAGFALSYAAMALDLLPDDTNTEPPTAEPLQANLPAKPLVIDSSDDEVDAPNSTGENAADPQNETQSGSDAGNSIGNDATTSAAPTEGSAPDAQDDKTSADADPGVNQLNLHTAQYIDPNATKELPTSRTGAKLIPPDPRTQRSGGNSSLLQTARQNWMLRTAGALGLVLTAIFLMRAIVRRMGGPMAGAKRPSGVLEVLGRYPFARGQSLVLLKLDRRILLLCQSGQSVQTLTELHDPEEVASLLRRVQDEEGESFNRRLESMLRHDAKNQGVRADDNGSTDRGSLLNVVDAPANRSELLHQNDQLDRSRFVERQSRREVLDDEAPNFVDLTRPMPKGRKGLLGRGRRGGLRS